MNAVPFDTLKLAKTPEASGMTGATAVGAAEALAEAMSSAEWATKADISGLRTELTGRLDVLRREIEISQRDVVIRLGGTLVVMSGLLLAAIRYLPPHP